MVVGTLERLRWKMIKFTGKNGITKFTAGNILGVLILLVICLLTFDGPLIPAIWQLTSLIWVVFWSYHCDKEENT